jgi:hypothetical protein
MVTGPLFAGAATPYLGVPWLCLFARARKVFRCASDAARPQRRPVMRRTPSMRSGLHVGYAAPLPWSDCSLLRTTRSPRTLRVGGRPRAFRTGVSLKSSRSAPTVRVSVQYRPRRCMLHGGHVVGCTARARVSGPSAPLESCARHIPTHGMALGHCGHGTGPLWAWHSYLPGRDRRHRDWARADRRRSASSRCEGPGVVPARRGASGVQSAAGLCTTYRRGVQVSPDPLRM